MYQFSAVYLNNLNKNIYKFRSFDSFVGFFHHLHDNRFWLERFLVEMIIFANFKTWKEPPEITNLHIIWFIQFDISRRIDTKNNNKTNKQTVDFLKKMVVDIYAPRQANNYTIRMLLLKAPVSQNIRRFFFFFAYDKTAMIHSEIIICQSARFVRRTARRKTVFCVAKQFKDAHQFVLLFACVTL